MGKFKATADSNMFAILVNKVDNEPMELKFA